MGVLYPAYRFIEIVDMWGIDAPFEDFTNNPLLVNTWYNMQAITEGIRDAIIEFAQ
jgi:hypothetical protein